MNMREVVAALEVDPAPPQKYISTGSMVLDMAMKGWPEGRLSEITGDEMSGKTTLAYVAAAEMQKLREEPVLWIDLRGEFSPRKAEAAGVHPGQLLVMHGIPTRYGIGVGPFQRIVADAVTGQEDAEELLYLARAGRTVVATSWRYRMFTGTFPWVDLKYSGKNTTTAYVTTPTVHDKAVARLRVCHQGIDRPMELMDLAEKAGMITQKGSHWYLRYKGSPTTEYLGSGREKAAKALQYEKVASAVRSVLQQR